MRDSTTLLGLLVAIWLDRRLNRLIHDKQEIARAFDVDANQSKVLVLRTFHLLRSVSDVGAQSASEDALASLVIVGHWVEGELANFRREVGRLAKIRGSRGWEVTEVMQLVLPAAVQILEATYCSEKGPEFDLVRTRMELEIQARGHAGSAERILIAWWLDQELKRRVQRTRRSGFTKQERMRRMLLATLHGLGGPAAEAETLARDEEAAESWASGLAVKLKRELGRFRPVLGNELFLPAQALGLSHMVAEVESRLSR